jgi:hypothetical protein
MAESIIDSFYNNESNQKQVNQPNEDPNSSQDDNLGSTSNSENQGENQNKGEKDQEKTETPAVEKAKEHWSTTAYLDEKGKRQELEKELKEFKTQFLQPKEEVKKPDAIDDPEAAINYSENQTDQKLWKQKVELTETFAKDKFSDYEEKKNLFMDLVKDDPSLAQKLRNSVNPALFAYNHAKHHLKVKEFSNPEYEKNLREQIKSELLGEMNEKQDSNNSNSSQQPVVRSISLTDTTGSKNFNNNKSSGNPLTDMFKGHHLG